MAYWLIALAAAPIVGLFFFREIRKAGMPLNALQVFMVVQVFLLFGYVFSRAATLVEERIRFGAWPPMDEWVRPSFHWYGAVLGVSLVWVVLGLSVRKAHLKKVLVFFNVVAQTACVALFFGKLGCFADGHYGCGGVETSLPWGVCYSWGELNSPVPLHPVQLYDALFVLVQLWVIRRYVPFEHSATAFLVGQAVFQILVEFICPMPKLFFGMFNLAQVTYAIIFLLGVLSWYIIRVRYRIVADEGRFSAQP